MVAVMLYRGHSRRSAGEMAAVMIAPVVPFVGLEVSHVITGPVAGPYMCVSMFAMIALIVHRRRGCDGPRLAWAVSGRTIAIGGNY